MAEDFNSKAEKMPDRQRARAADVYSASKTAKANIKAKLAKMYEMPSGKKVPSEHS